MGILKPQKNNTVIGTQAIDGWAITFGTAMMGLGGLGCVWAPPSPLLAVPNVNSYSPPINGQCTNFILFHVAL